MWWISGGSGVAILSSVCGSSSSSLSLQWICLPCSNGKLTQIEWWIFWEDWDMSVARRLLRYYMKLQPLAVSVMGSEFRPADHFWRLPFTVLFDSHCELPPCKNWDFIMRWNWKIHLRNQCTVNLWDQTRANPYSNALSHMCWALSTSGSSLQPHRAAGADTDPGRGSLVPPASSAPVFFLPAHHLTRFWSHWCSTWWSCVAWASLGPRNFRLCLNTCGLSKTKYIPDMPLIILGVLGTLLRIYFYKSGSKSWFLTQTTRRQIPQTEDKSYHLSSLSLKPLHCNSFQCCHMWNVTLHGNLVTGGAQIPLILEFFKNVMFRTLCL